MMVQTYLSLYEDLQKYAAFLTTLHIRHGLLAPPKRQVGFQFGPYWIYNRKKKTWKSYSTRNFAYMNVQVKRLQ